MTRGRPRSNDPLRRLEFRAGAKDRERLARIAEKKGIKRSKAIRLAIAHFDSFLAKQVGDGTMAAVAQRPEAEAGNEPASAPSKDPVLPCPLCGRRLGASYHKVPHARPPEKGGKCPGVPA